MKRLALLAFAALIIALVPQPTQAGNLALYIHMNNWSARSAWVTVYSCGIFGCDIERAMEAGTNRQGSGQYTNVTTSVSQGSKFKVRIEITRPDGSRVDRSIESNANVQHWNACIHSDYTFTWC
jgi:hypothetical protein